VGRSALLFAVTVVLAGGCVSGSGGLQVLSIDEVGVSPVRSGASITDYPRALASIVAVMDGDLDLPPVEAALHFYPDRDAFRAALEAEGYGAAFAEDAAANLSGIAGFRRVLLNDAALRWIEWPYRVSFLAHELTHTLQYELSNGRRGTSDQWLREGFGDWVRIAVIDALDLTPRDEARRVALGRVRDGARRRPSPALSELVTFEDWVAAIQTFGEDPTYAQALLAVELLIDRHGLGAVLDYFRRFAESDDRLANFRATFGEPIPDFEAAFREHLARVL